MPGARSTCRLRCAAFALFCCLPCWLVAPCRVAHLASRPSLRPQTAVSRWRSGGSALTIALLTQLVEQALQANADVRSARAALHQARALRDAMAAALRPRVNAAASVQASSSASNENQSTPTNWVLTPVGSPTFSGPSAVP